MEPHVRPLCDLELRDGDIVCCVSTHEESRFTPGATYRIDEDIFGDLFVETDDFGDRAVEHVDSSKFYILKTPAEFTEDELEFLADLEAERARMSPEALDGEGGDIINRPDHYTYLPIQPKEFIIRNNFEFWRGNIVKYASRAGFKMYPDMDSTDSEIADLEKVIRYAEMRINVLKGEMEV